MFKKINDRLLEKCVKEDKGKEKVEQLHGATCKEEDPGLYQRLQRWEYLDAAVLSLEKIKTKKLKKKLARYFLQKGELFKKSFTGKVLKCVRDKEKDKVLEEVHQGVCKRNQGGRALQYKLIRIGYYW
ncbi:hypothetical protein Ahy_A09g043126 [Arachis hypogaea]|uniref:Integrase zinc-binding domain-containing protein n=1 Tax=Arachis hypogaea TaxID=3818 RepID=A0A445BHK7_ARAHY|nr:hypothetical protein Ahy_A09g043126 [Arachis hypogaea]